MRALQQKAAKENSTVSTKSEAKQKKQKRTTNRSISLEDRHHLGKVPISSLSNLPIQAKLQIDSSNNYHEKEADRIANQVIQRKQKDQKSAISNIRMDTLSPSKDNVSASTVLPHQKDAFQSELKMSKGRGRPMESGLTQEMNQSFGYDFSHVRIHRDAEAIKMNETIRAKAFTHKNDIYFNRGNFTPETTKGKHLLAHELTHVIQQDTASHSVHLIQRAPDPLSLTQSVNPTSMDIPALRREIRLINAWLAENPTDPNRDLLVGPLSALQAELSRKVSQQSAATESNRQSRSSGSNSSQPRRRQAPKPNPRSLNESIDPSTLSEAALEREIRLIRSWLLRHSEDHPQYHDMQGTLSVFEAAVTAEDEALMSIDPSQAGTQEEPASLRQSIDPDQLSEEELQAEHLAIQNWLADHPEENEDRTQLLASIGRIEAKVAGPERPPFIWGMDQNNRALYLSITQPGTSLQNLAVYLYGSAAGVAHLQQVNEGLSEFLLPGTVLRFPGGMRSEVNDELNDALANGEILRTDGIPESANQSEQMGFVFNHNGQELQLTEVQMQGLLNGLKVYLQRKSVSLQRAANDLLAIRNQHISETNLFNIGGFDFSPTREISNLAAGQSIPSELVFNVPIRGANRLVAALESGELTPTFISQRARQMQLVGSSLELAQNTWNEYIQRTIEGAEVTIKGLEFVRDTAFTIAIAIGAAAAAPIVFSTIGSSALLATAGTTATNLVAGAGTFVTVTAGGAGAGAALRGSTSLAGQALTGDVDFGEVGDETIEGGRRGGIDAASSVVTAGTGSLLGPGSSILGRAGAGALSTGAGGFTSGFLDTATRGINSDDPNVQSGTLGESLAAGGKGFLTAAPGGVLGRFVPGQQSSSVVNRVLAQGTVGGAGDAAGVLITGGSTEDAGKAFATGFALNGVTGLANQTPRTPRNTPPRPQDGGAALPLPNSPAAATRPPLSPQVDVRPTTPRLRSVPTGGQATSPPRGQLRLVPDAPEVARPANTGTTPPLAEVRPINSGRRRQASPLRQRSQKPVTDINEFRRRRQANTTQAEESAQPLPQEQRLQSAVGEDFRPIQAEPEVNTRPLRAVASNSTTSPRSTQVEGRSRSTTTSPKATSRARSTSTGDPSRPPRRGRTVQSPEETTRRQLQGELDTANEWEAAARRTLDAAERTGTSRADIEAARSDFQAARALQLEAERNLLQHNNRGAIAEVETRRAQVDVELAGQNQQLARLKARRSKVQRQLQDIEGKVRAARTPGRTPGNRGGINPREIRELRAEWNRRLKQRQALDSDIQRAENDAGRLRAEIQGLNRRENALRGIPELPLEAGGRFTTVQGESRLGQIEANHVPGHASYDGVIGLNRSDGPAISMTKADHGRLQSSISAEYRARQRRLIAEGRFEEAFRNDIQDIRNNFPDGRYERGIRMAEAYLRELQSTQPERLTPRSD